MICLSGAGDISHIALGGGVATICKRTKFPRKQTQYCLVTYEWVIKQMVELSVYAEMHYRDAWDSAELLVTAEGSYKNLADRQNL